MDISSKLINALSAFQMPVQHGVYSGEEERYFTFSYASKGEDFADDAPQYERFFVQLHFFCPGSDDSTVMAANVKAVLFAAGFTWPELNSGADVNRQQLSFTCEIVEQVNVEGMSSK